MVEVGTMLEQRLHVHLLSGSSMRKALNKLDRSTHGNCTYLTLSKPALVAVVVISMDTT